jgi:hypothetical protein
LQETANFITQTSLQEPMNRFVIVFSVAYISSFQFVYMSLHDRAMYVYSRGGPHTALAPRPSLIYCAYDRDIIWTTRTDIQLRVFLVSLNLDTSNCINEGKSVNRPQIEVNPL